jgi:hypothetical protein
LIASGEVAVVSGGEPATWAAAGKTWAAAGRRLMLAKPADNRAIESGIRTEDR